MQTCSAERQTHTRPARRPPQHSHHSALTTSSMAARPLTNTHSPWRHQTPQGSGAGIRKGLQATSSSCPLQLQQPDDGSTPGTCPPATARIWSFSPAHSKQKHWHSSACGVPGKAHPTTVHHLKTQSPAPAPASSLWHLFLQSTILKSFALLVHLRGFVIRDVRKDKALPVASRMKRFMLGNYKRPQTCQCKAAYALLPSTSKTNLGAHKQGLERDRTAPYAVGYGLGGTAPSHLA